ncbi:hypothetical protein GMMP15_1240020 [Candidatus Magnetomoraceae bacterium gMMP-15]
MRFVKGIVDSKESQILKEGFYESNVDVFFNFDVIDRYRMFI